jgi:hypothetical protein
MIVDIKRNAGNPSWRSCSTKRYIFNRVFLRELGDKDIPQQTSAMAIDKKLWTILQQAIWCRWFGTKLIVSGAERAIKKDNGGL